MYAPAIWRCCQIGGVSDEMRLTVGNAVLQDRIELNPRSGTLRFPVAAARALPQQALTRKPALLALIPRRVRGELRQRPTNFCKRGLTGSFVAF